MLASQQQHAKPYSVAARSIIWVVISLLPNLGLGVVGLWLGAFDLSGFIAGLMVGWLITYAFGVGGFFTLVGFVALGSIATRIGYRRKADRGIAEPHGGTRRWQSAMGNLAVAAALAGFRLGYDWWFLSLAMVASLATAAFDTVASELGKAYGRRTVSLRGFKGCDAGTPGGISVQGSLGGAFASLLVSLTAFGFDLIGPQQIGLIVAASGLAMIFEAYLKARALARSAQVANLINTATGAVLACLMVAAAT